MTNELRPVYLGLGANLGEPRVTFSSALEMLQAAIGPLRAVSSRYRSLALVLPGDEGSYPPFENIVAEFESDLGAQEILRDIITVEDALGRERSSEKRWGPRTIDIDILAVGSEVVATKTLRVPHAGLFERDFVLIPWAEIAAEFLIPRANGEVSVANALKQLNSSGQPLYVRFNLGAL